MNATTKSKEKGGLLKVKLNWEELPDLLTVPEAATFLRRGMNCVYDLCHSEGFPAIKIGRTWRIVKTGLKAWVEEQCA